eukprot:TRINITY_DN2290_c0_g2_i1.p1 TRINITY_DN2290_c0_g2~~TRINITY_DN2290_c0_g2_i1.p1  ORF type:complete len:370 (-),score=75.17 TRINITY_DN2290_c0_g2_i1:94-1203(-)
METQFLKGLLYKFALPTTKSIAFHKVIRTVDQKSQDDLIKTSNARDEMLSQLEKGEIGSPATVQAIERYIPFLYGLVIAVEGQPHVRLNDPLCFNWTSGIGNNKKFTPEYTYRFEVAMTLITYGISLANRAWTINENTTPLSFDEDSKQAAHFLRLASGVFDYVNMVELPRWINLPASRPAETLPHAVTALSHLCIASAQDITVKKAVEQKTVKSKAMITKLAAEVWRRNELTFMEFKNMGDDFKKCICSPLQKYLVLATLMGKANAYRFAGITQQEAGSLGKAVSYLNVAVQALNEIPLQSGDLATWKTIATEMKADIEHIHRAFTKENDMIVFDRVPDESSLEIPEPKCLMTPIPYNPPYPAFSDIH